jgi:hypothetical protein
MPVFYAKIAIVIRLGQIFVMDVEQVCGSFLLITEALASYF